MDVQAPLLDDYLYLAGRPSIREFVGFARRHKINGVRPDKEALCGEWRAASEHISRLEKTEKGIADDLELSAIPDEMRQTADAALDVPGIRTAWEGLSYQWRLVEIDRVVVFQKSINLRFVSEIKSAIPERFTHEDIIRVAVGQAWQTPPIRVTRSEEYTFLCMSNSNDVRILEIESLDPRQIQDFDPPGHPGAVIAICVGFTTNILSAVKIRNRLVLINGSHRAYALRDSGVTHVPCLVLDLPRPDDFEMKAPEAVKASPDLYLKSARPPLFKDYRDPLLHKLVQQPRTNQLVQLQIGYQKISLAAV